MGRKKGSKNKPKTAPIENSVEPETKVGEENGTAIAE